MIMTKDDFKFNINAKRLRLSDDELLSSVKKYAEKFGYRYFPSTEYDKWKEKIGHSATIVPRFGSWKKVLLLLGIEGGREHYTTEQLIKNLEDSVFFKEVDFTSASEVRSEKGVLQSFEINCTIESAHGSG